MNVSVHDFMHEVNTRDRDVRADLACSMLSSINGGLIVATALITTRVRIFDEWTTVQTVKHSSLFTSRLDGSKTLPQGPLHRHVRVTHRLSSTLMTHYYLHNCKAL
jgi:hypothetical protein